MHKWLALLGLLILVSCSSDGAADEVDPMAVARTRFSGAQPPTAPGVYAGGQAVNLGSGQPAGLIVKQAPTGVSNFLVQSQDNQISWQNVIRYPQPGQESNDPGISLAMRVAPGLFSSAAGEGLKVIARIQWDIGNSLNLAVIDVPSNSNIRIPLSTGRVIVDVATVLTTVPAATFSSFMPSFFEAPPPAMFKAAVPGLLGNTTSVPTVSIGINPGGGYGPIGGALPQRQIEVLVGAGNSFLVPRPSGAANFQYLTQTGAAISGVGQQVVGSVGLYTALGPDILNKLLTDAYGISVVNGAGTALVGLSFDIGF